MKQQPITIEAIKTAFREVIEARDRQRLNEWYDEQLEKHRRYQWRLQHGEFKSWTESRYGRGWLK